MQLISWSLITITRLKGGGAEPFKEDRTFLNLVCMELMVSAGDVIPVFLQAASGLRSEANDASERLK